MISSDPAVQTSRRVRKAIKHNLIFRTLSQAATAATYILLVRLFSEHDFGIYQLFYSIPPVIAAVFSLGITNTLSRFMPEYLHAKRYGLARTLLSWSLRIRFVSSIVILSLAIILWDHFSEIFKISEYKNYFILFAFTVVTHFQCRLLSMSLAANLLQQWSMGLTAAFLTAKLLGYLIVAVAFGFSLWAALVVDLIAYLLWYAAVSWANRSFMPRPSEPESFSRAEGRRVLRYSFFNNFNDIGSLTLNARTDNLFIAAFLNPVHVGAYAFCTQLDSMIQKILPARFFGMIVRPLVFRLDYRSEAARARKAFQFLLRLNYLFVFPIFVLVVAIPVPLIDVVFGGKFSEYSNVLIAVFAFSLLSGFHQPVTIIAELGEKAGIILTSKIFAIYNVAAILILIPTMGLMGAAVATGTAGFFKNLFIWYFVKGVASFRGTGKFFATQTGLWTVSGYAIHAISQRVPPHVSLIAACLIIAVTTPISWRVTDFSSWDREMLKKLGGPRVQNVLRLFSIIR